MTETSALDIDAIASALTPELIRPFEYRAVHSSLVRPTRIAFARATYAAMGVRGQNRAPAEMLVDSTAHHAALSIEARLVDLLGREHVVASHGTIERAADPAAFVDALARRLDGASVLVLSTRLRPLTMTVDHPGPPEHVAHHREWTFPELQAFLDAMGLDVLFGGVCADDADGTAGETAVMIALRGP